MSFAKKVWVWSLSCKFTFMYQISKLFQLAKMHKSKIILTINKTKNVSHLFFLYIRIINIANKVLYQTKHGRSSIYYLLLNT